MKKVVAVLMALTLALVLLPSSVGAEETSSYQIVAPEEGEFIFGSTTFEAAYSGEDTGWVQWAVRHDTCDQGTNTVFGNVDGHTDEYSWQFEDEVTIFSAEANTSEWDAGQYCFVFNPQNGGRYTRWFYVVSQYVSGGGQLVEEQGNKRQDWYVVSFGGEVADAGSALVGEMQINFHNVSEDSLYKARFHTTKIKEMNFFTGECGIAMNFTADGVLNGEEGYSIVFRAQDAGEPGCDDNVRIQLSQAGQEIYDTRDDFGAESDCHGTQRAMLAAGNLQMETR